MYDQTGKLWFKIIAFIVMEAFLFTIADTSWAANYREQKGNQQALVENQKTKDERNNLSADALGDQLVLTQPAMPYLGFEHIMKKGEIESMPLIDTTISGLTIAGNDLPTIFKTLKNSGATVGEAGFGALRQGFSKKEIYHALIKAGYDKEEVQTLLGGLLKAEEDKKEQKLEESEDKTGPPLEKEKQQEKAAKTQTKEEKEGLFEIPKVTELPVEKEAAKVVEKSTKEAALLRQTVEFVRIMIKEGKRGVELIRVLKKAGLTNERIVTALAQIGFNLKDIITILKEANISCRDIVQALHQSKVNYSDKEIYVALLKAGYTDKDIVAAFKAAGISARDILATATELSRNMTEIAKAMVDAGFSFGEIARAYLLKTMKGVWDETINIVNCAVKAFDAFLTNIGRKFTSKEELAYELIVDDILSTGEVDIKGKDVMTSMAAMKNVARKYGVDLEGYKLDVKSLMELGENVIIFLDGDHWVTLVSIDGDSATIIDNGEKKVISLSGLKIRWDGSTLALNKQQLKYNQLLELQMRQIRGGRGGIGGFFSSIWKGIKKVFSAVWKAVKKVLVSSIFRFLMVVVAVVCAVTGIGMWITALILATMTALRTAAAGGSFLDCLKSFAVTFVMSVACSVAGNMAGSLASGGQVTLSSAFASTASQTISSAVSNAVVGQVVSLGIQAVGKQIGLDKTAWGRVLMAVVTAVATAYVSSKVTPKVNEWMNGSDSPGSSQDSTGPPDTSPNNPSNSGNHPYSTPNTNSAGQITSYKTNWSAITVSAVTAAAQQITYEMCVANKVDIYTTQALTTAMGALAYSIAGATFAQSDAQIYDASMDGGKGGLKSAGNFSEAFGYYFREAVPDAVGGIIGVAMNSIGAQQGLDPAITYAMSSTLSAFARGATRLALGNPSGTSADTKFWRVTAESLATGMKDWAIGEQAKLMDMDATDLHIMYAMMNSIASAAADYRDAKGLEPNTNLLKDPAAWGTLTGGAVNQLLRIYVNAANFGGGTSQTSYSNATSAFKASQFADHIVNRNEWQDRDNVSERTPDYVKQQSSDQGKIGFWDAYMDLMNENIDSAAQNQTSLIVTTALDKAITNYEVNKAIDEMQDKEYISVDSNGNVTVNAQYRADMVKFMKTNFSNITAANAFRSMLQTEISGVVSMSGDDFKDMLTGGNYSVIEKIKTAEGTTKRNAYSYLDTGGGTYVMVKATDVEGTYSAANLKYTDATMLRITSVAYLENSNKMIRTTKVLEALTQQVLNWTVHDVETGFLMSSSATPGLWANVTEKTGEIVENGKVIYKIALTKLNSDGTFGQEIGEVTVNATYVRDSRNELVMKPDTAVGTGYLQVVMQGEQTKIDISYNVYSGAMDLASTEKNKALLKAGDMFQSALNDKTYTVKQTADGSLIARSETSMIFDENNKLRATELVGSKDTDYLTGSFTAISNLSSVVSIKGNDVLDGREGVLFTQSNGAQFLVKNENLVSLNGNNLSLLSARLYSDSFNTHLSKRVEMIKSGAGAGQSQGGINHIYLTTKNGEIFTNGEISIQRDKFVLTNMDAVYTDANTQFTLYLRNEDGTVKDVATVGEMGRATQGIIVENTYIEVFAGANKNQAHEFETGIKDDSGLLVSKFVTGSLDKNSKVQISEVYENTNDKQVQRYNTLENNEIITHFAVAGATMKVKEAYSGKVEGQDVFYDADVVADKDGNATGFENQQFFIKAQDIRTNVQVITTYDLTIKDSLMAATYSLRERSMPMLLALKKRPLTHLPTSMTRR